MSMVVEFQEVEFDNVDLFTKVLVTGFFNFHFVEFDSDDKNWILIQYFAKQFFKSCPHEILLQVH